MALTSISPNLRVPFVYVEFDNSKAQQGPSVQPFTTLIVGQKVSAGTQAELELVTVTSPAQGYELFGNRSQIAGAIAKYLDNDKVTEVKAMAIDDDAGANFALGKLTVAAGTATAGGTVYLYIGGRQITAAVAKGDDQDAVAAAIVAAITADPYCYVTAAVNGTNANEVDLTAANGGEVGNEIDLRFNHFETESFPDGISASVTTAMAGGSGNPDIGEIIALLPETQFNVIVHPWKDATNLTALEDELADRFGPIRQNDGVAFAAEVNTLGNLSTLGNGRNSPHSSIMGWKGMPNPGFEIAAAYAGQVSKEGQADPARPFQTLQLVGIMAPKPEDEFTLQERNILLTDGIATGKVSGGVCRIERAITTFQTNAAGAPDTSYLDVNTLMTLSYLRYDFRNSFLLKYPRHKLANDGTRIGPGQQVLTPKRAKGFALERFQGWESLGLAEGFDQFKRDLVVERSATDPNRLEFLLPPDLVNQMRVAAASIQFLL